jgi:hypothetical protein
VKITKMRAALDYKSSKSFFHALRAVSCFLTFSGHEDLHIVSWVDNQNNYIHKQEHFSVEKSSVCPLKAVQNVVLR